MYTLGFIGGGNMATAMIAGAVTKAQIDKGHVLVYDKDSIKMQTLVDAYGVTATSSIGQLASLADILILAVKPNVVTAVLQEIDVPGKAIVSIAAGYAVEKIRENLCVSARIQRLMPNTPLMVGEGATVFATPTDLLPAELSCVKNLFSCMGTVYEADEALLHAVTGVSGSGPAYLYMFLDAMAKEGVALGLDPDLALATAAQTAIGAATMILQTGKTPEQLRIDVCSPGGTTLEAVRVFQERNLEGITRDAVKAAHDKSRILSR